jgi:hypothetical protein
LPVAPYGAVLAGTAPVPVDELGAHRRVYQLKGLSPKARETAMRTFLTAHWKSIVALILLVLLAILTMSPGAASADLHGCGSTATTRPMS